ncbi:hypothetical protein LX36DRAFT_668941 [Colletotrichum falcatum]|nr:hypothetical protein LX36DRAFT_668941 [Colletotrichum falcatum]
MEFHLFGVFPPEVRELIWRLALPEDEPEVCIVQPACDTPQSLIVYTAFPVLMHETRHLAVSGQKEYINLLAWILLFYFPKLETLSVVVNDLSVDSCFESHFDAPKARCKLRIISGEPTMSVIMGAKKSVDVRISGPVHLSGCMENYTHELEKYMVEYVEDMDRTKRKSHQWWDMESNAVRTVKYSIQAFAEYKADGAFSLNGFV